MSDIQSTVQYKDIQGFSGYRVGDDGSAWTCKKVVCDGRIKGGIGLLRSVIGDTWRLLKPYKNKRGYSHVG